MRILLGGNLSLIAPRSLLAAACMLVACSEEAGAIPYAEAGKHEPQDSATGAGPDSGRGSGDAGHALDAGSSLPWQPIIGTEGVADAAAFIDGSLIAVDSGAAPRAERIPLVVHDLWRRVEAPADPFEDRPALAGCSASATMAEVLAGESAFSIDTGSCNYLTARQPTLFDVAEGQPINVRLWHFELSAPEPAEAHVAVVIDGLLLLDERVAIPHAGGLISKQVRAARAIPAGATVYLHLHNHGANSWSLIEVSSGP
jgi:hypothetical protein